MYSLKKKIPLPKSPSMGFNNLSSLIAGDKLVTVCYSHRSWLIFLTLDSLGEVYSEEALDLHTDSSVALEPQLMLMEDQLVCAVAGLGSLVLAHKSDSWMITSKIKLSPETSTTCVTHFGPKIAFGCSTGEIMLVNWKKPDRIETDIQTHTSAITSITASDDYFVCAEETSFVSLRCLRNDKHSEVYYKFDIQDLALIMAIHDYKFFALSSNGILYIHHLEQREFLAEVRLHVRTPVAMQINKQGKLLTAAEDGLLYVWSPKDTHEVLKLEECIEIKETTVVGAAWTQTEGNSFLVASYDRPHLSLYSIYGA